MMTTDGMTVVVTGVTGTEVIETEVIGTEIETVLAAIDRYMKWKRLLKLVEGQRVAVSSSVDIVIVASLLSKKWKENFHLEVVTDAAKTMIFRGVRDPMAVAAAGTTTTTMTDLEKETEDVCSTGIIGRNPLTKDR